MVDGMMEICPKCQKNIALVGRRHQCQSVSENSPASRPQPRATKTRSSAPSQPSPSTLSAPQTTTYEYRDPEKRRAYMREYAKKRRALKRAEREAKQP